MHQTCDITDTKTWAFKKLTNGLKGKEIYPLYSLDPRDYGA